MAKRQVMYTLYKKVGDDWIFVYQNTKKDKVYEYDSKRCNGLLTKIIADSIVKSSRYDYDDYDNE